MKREPGYIKKLAGSLFLSGALLTSTVFSAGVFAEETPTKPAVSETMKTITQAESTAKSAKTTGEMSKAQKERAMAQMGKNQGNVWVWSEENVVDGQKRGPNGGPGQLNGGSVVLGGKPSYDPPADWYYLGYLRDGMTDEQARALFETQRGKFMDRLDPWGVVVEMQDNKAANAWYDVRNMQAFVLREGETKWENIMNDPAAIDWVDYYEGNMYGHIGQATSEKRGDGSTSVQIMPKEDKVAHWGSKQVTSVASPESIRAILISVEARISDKSDPNAKLGIQVGADWKFSDENPAERPLWYPGAGLSGIQRLTNDWDRYYFVSLQGIQDAMPERAITAEKFLATVLPLEDPQKTEVEDTKPTEKMSRAEKERAVAQMGKNQGNVWVWSEENVVEGQKRGPNGGPGQFNAGSVVLGGRPTYDPPADWYYLGYKKEGMTDDEAKALFDSQRGKFMDRMDPWGVVVEMQDNKATNAWYDVRNMQAFVLREGETLWENLMNDPAAIDWVDYFEGNMYGWVEPATKEKLAGVGTSVQMKPKQDKVAHWGSKQVLSVPKPETIRAILISVEARISEKSDPDAKLGIQVGADWKFSDESPAERPLWYPGAGLSGIQRLTNDWARYYFVSIQGVQDAMPERAIPVAQFFATDVPLPDLKYALQPYIPPRQEDTTVVADKPKEEKPKEEQPKQDKPKEDKTKAERTDNTTSETVKPEEKPVDKPQTEVLPENGVVPQGKTLPQTSGASLLGLLGWLMLSLGMVLKTVNKRLMK